jgi:hypothetical protein
MKNSKDYQNLKKQLQEIRANHKETHLDSGFIIVTGMGINWRQCKKLGMKKSAYYGWVFYSTSTNSNSYDLYEKIKKACMGFNLYVSERQL